MKLYLLLTVILFATGNVVFAQITHEVGANGNTFSPSSITINAGDSVHFSVGASHPTRQVSKSTWDDNGTTKLEGGFDFPSGEGTVGFPDAGTYYYVCTVHVGVGMKGKITVQAATAVNSVSDDNLTLYPDPVTGNELNVQFNRSFPDATIQVYDLSGNLRLSTLYPTASGSLSIDCTSLPSSLYLLRITTPAGFVDRKFVKL